VQFDPMKPTLKAPGSKRLKLGYDELLSHFAFKFNFRRYNLDLPRMFEDYVHRVGRTGRAGMTGRATSFYTVGWCRLKPMFASTESDVVRFASLTQRLRVALSDLTTCFFIRGACFQRLKLNCNELLSNVAFKFNLRRYHTDRDSFIVAQIKRALQELEARTLNPQP